MSFLFTLVYSHPRVEAFQGEKEESSTTVASFSSSSEEFHSSSESFSSEELSNSTTKAPRKPRRRTRNRKSNTGGGGAGGDISASHESASASSESFASTELVTATTSPLRNDSLPSPSLAPSARPAAPLKQLTECEVKNLKSDKCLREALFVGQESAVIPKTEAEMDSYCVVKKDDFNCIREFGSKCLKNVPRQIYLTITKNVRKMFKEFCDSPAGKRSMSMLVQATF